MFLNSLEELKTLRGIFDEDNLKAELEKISLELQKPEIWNDSELSARLSREQKSIEQKLDKIRRIKNSLDDALVALELQDETLIAESVAYTPHKRDKAWATSPHSTRSMRAR